MRVVIRADASVRSGTGHVMRCMALAEAVRERGADVHFVCREHAGNLIELLRAGGFAVDVLPVADTTFDGDRYALGATQAEDATQTIAALGGRSADWLIVDHYGIDHEWHEKLRPNVGSILVIDDLAEHRHDCDLLLDQNFHVAGEQRYRQLVPQACRTLLGPRHALLRTFFADFRSGLAERTGVVNRVLIFFGGSDPRDMTGMALRALTDPAFADVAVDVVAGANYLHIDELRAAVARRPRTQLYGPRPHLADLMSRADLAIGAGGTTTWERMCLGVPSIVISIAENQCAPSLALSRQGLLNYLGNSEQVTVDDLRDALHESMRRPDLLRRLRANGQLLVDGFGTRRIAELLIPTAPDGLSLREARPSDAAMYFVWANDAEVRRQSIRSEPISWEQHSGWFEGRLADRSNQLWVLQAGALAVGQIRFDEHEGTARIGYSIDRLFRGRGWGKYLVAAGIERYRRAGKLPVRAEVKPENMASAAVFIGLGFVEHARSADGLRVFQLEPRG